MTLGAVVALVRDRGLAEEATVRGRVADLFALERSIDLFARRVGGAVAVGADPGPLASIGKLATARLAKATSALALDIAGQDAIAWDPDKEGGGLWAYGVLYAPALSIAGGTDQIQRTILGERVLGLPREPQPDRDTPFRALPRS